ncbi:hypothetical protein GVAV_000930 [Gurleya vavrai]
MTSPEDHKANGRIERFIGTIREMFYKTNGMNIKEKIDKVISVYNNTYHSAIKCTPFKAMFKNNIYKNLPNNLFDPRNRKCKNHKNIKKN